MDQPNLTRDTSRARMQRAVRSWRRRLTLHLAPGTTIGTPTTATVLEWDAETEGDAPLAYETAPGLPSPVLALFAESANSEVTVEAAYAPLSIRTPLYRDPDGWTPIRDWATAELLNELSGAEFTRVRLVNRGRDSVTHEVALDDLIRPFGGAA